MNKADWRRIKEIVHAALDRRPETWPAFVNAQCAGDRNLRREVVSLLEASQSMGDFIETPILDRLRPPEREEDPQAPGSGNARGEPGRA